jgi:hypothetical protein
MSRSMSIITSRSRSMSLERPPKQRQASMAGQEKGAAEHWLAQQGAGC